MHLRHSTGPRQNHWARLPRFWHRRYALLRLWLPWSKFLTIHIWFSWRFSWKLLWDVLLFKVRDGDNSNSTLIGRFCGDPHQAPATILSTHNYIWMKFVTDSSDSFQGFMANYTSINIGWSIRHFIWRTLKWIYSCFLLNFQGCGGILTSPEGSISSPTHSEMYERDTTCRWIIRADPGKVIQLRWLTFSLEDRVGACTTDYVEIFDNTTVPNAGGSLGRWIQIRKRLLLIF